MSDFICENITFHVDSFFTDESFSGILIVSNAMKTTNCTHPEIIIWAALDADSIIYADNRIIGADVKYCWCEDVQTEEYLEECQLPLTWSEFGGFLCELKNIHGF